MSSMGARSRPASMSVPAPPPPSPLCDVLGRKYATVVTLADVEELLRLLCSKTNTTIPVSDLAVPRPAEPAPVPPTRADETDDENEANEKITMLTVPGHGGVADSSSRDRLAPASTDAGPVTPPDSAAASLPPSRPRPGCAPTDAGDESLQRYKESLGLGGGKDLSDASDPRVCIIQSLTLETPGRDPVTIDLSVPGTEATLKDHPFTIKEGSRFTMVATFKVQHEVLSGLRYVQVVKRKGVRVGKDSEMLGSYAPNTDKQPLYTKRCKHKVTLRSSHEAPN